MTAPRGRSGPEAPRRQRDKDHPGPTRTRPSAARPHQAVRYDPDGRIFQTARGGILQDSCYNEVWTEARKQALTPAQQRSPLGRRPYDLRHAAVSLWLNSGVPATEVARRARHGVAVLLKIYAHCIDGQADAAKQRITDALGTTEPESGPGGEEDDDSEQAS
jgi:integrase